MLNEMVKMFGTLSVKLIDSNGNLKENREIKNLVVNTGKAFIAQSMLKTTTNSPAAVTHIGIGSGTAAAAVTDTTLASQLGNRSTVTASNVTTSVTNDSAQYVATFAAGEGTGAVTEAGLFNASTGGTMVCRTVFSVINKSANDSLVITWKVTVA